ncbi:NlpC/P60 family protein [Streptomyces roseolus]|uniref:NlpC/P60 family protein n=1 Tax=Streptomyces roseolus TaxID=67358 RepID=UPI0037B5D0AA
MRDKTRRVTRPAVHTATVLSLLAAGAYLTVELHQQERAKAPAVPTVTDRPLPVSAGSVRHTAGRTWERLRNPSRSVLRTVDGEVLATFTDGARTATLTGPRRAFAEPRTTESRVVTRSWVRLLPEEWEKGAEREEWFADWFGRYFGSQEDDLFATAFAYVDGAPVKRDSAGVAYAGDASYGPFAPHGPGKAKRRLEQSDFYDYLGVPHTFQDGTTMRPEKTRFRSMDCSGYIRALLGYRNGYPLLATDGPGDGLPRTADGMARSDRGVDVIPLGADVRGSGLPPSTDVLQPGDLVFFKLDDRTKDRLDHVGMYVGHDTDGHRIFISSRKKADGPTIGDKGGTSRLDGHGHYAEALRSAKRL